MAAEYPCRVRIVPHRSDRAQLVSLAGGVAELVRDGDSVALEGFTHLIPFAAGHELVRQGRRDLELIRMTPDLLYDQLIGMGCARRLVFSYGGNPGVGSLHRFRDAVENGWPHPIELEEHSHAGMANRFAAGASDLPFAVMRGYRGNDLARRTQVATVTCPFTGEELAAVPALRPDVAIVHAQEADKRGNVQLWGIPGVQKEAVLAARRSLVTVERIVDELELRPGGVVIPGWVIDAVAEAPGGSQPSYSHGLTERDNDFYRQWDQISRDRDGFRAWMEEHVLGRVAAG
jgi:glutaconate CoA-transferase, subunit A